MTKALTKEMLKEWGITHIDWCEREQQWWINRYCSIGIAKKPSNHRLKISKAVCKHKYTKDKVYNIVAFSHKNKTISIPLGRLIYVWFVEDIPEGNWDIDHRNNHSLDDRVENLQLLTREQNLAKRFSDNPDCNRNQFDALSK